VVAGRWKKKITNTNAELSQLPQVRRDFQERQRWPLAVRAEVEQVM